MRFACVHTRTSSLCTTTSKRSRSSIRPAYLLDTPGFSVFLERIFAAAIHLFFDMLKGVESPIFTIAFTLGISFIAVFLGVLLNNARLGDVTGRVIEMKELLRAEIKASAAEIRADLAEREGKLRGEIAEVRGEIAEVLGEIDGVRGDIKEFRGDLTLIKQVMESRLERLEVILERHHSELVV